MTPELHINDCWNIYDHQFTINLIVMLGLHYEYNIIIIKSYEI